MKLSVIAFLGLVANVAFTNVNAIELTADNYEFETEGKTAMIKFFAPWCGHCKKMKPDWDKLMEEFKDSKTQLVADVDCTSDGGKPLCEANGVRGYPTLKWGDPSALEDYSGQRDFKSLQTFANEKLVAMCSPTHLDLCDDDHKKEIETFLALGEAELEKKVAEKQGELDAVEADFKTFVEDLQEKYKTAMTDKDAKLDEIKASGLSLMQKCLVSLKKKSHDGSEL